MRTNRYVTAIFLTGVLVVARESQGQEVEDGAGQLPVLGGMPSFMGATAWLNSPPLKVPELRGKVVVVNFWTYTCINSIRALPYLRAWAEKYKDAGLIVVGVHTPEFEFEKDLQNVRQAVGELKVEYPVAIDSGRLVWRAFENDYWPAFYVLDANGRVRHLHKGEGDYAASERVIQQLLVESGADGNNRELVTVEARGVQAAPDWDNIQSPETYLGFHRSESFASYGAVPLGRQHVYALPEQGNLNDWALAGVWTVGKPSAVLDKAGGRIVFRFHARDLNLVMGPAMKGTTVRFRVLLDGQPAGLVHGVDVDAQGTGKVSEQRMYQLIRQSAPIGDRTFEIEFLDPGVEAFVFTFG
jgi:thiol-disulfide isomerase/thioredoxin